MAVTGYSLGNAGPWMGLLECSQAGRIAGEEAVKPRILSTPAPCEDSLK